MSAQMSLPSEAEGLTALEARAKHDLACLDYPAKAWVEPLAADVEGLVLDCALVGGGQFGLALAFGLKREHVGNIMVYDRSPAGLEGPWMSFARMDLLRTPKDLTGPDLGVGSLTFRAWYEAQHGSAGWEALKRIPRPVWMDFLRWYRRISILQLDRIVVGGRRDAGARRRRGQRPQISQFLYIRNEIFCREYT